MCEFVCKNQAKTKRNYIYVERASDGECEMLICYVVSKCCAIVKRFHRDHKLLNVNYALRVFLFTVGAAHLSSIHGN
jgi:hypothetical protein